MQIKLKIGGIGIWINGCAQYEISEMLAKYIDTVPKDVEIDIITELNEKISTYPLVGEDLFCRYYCMGNGMEIELKGAEGVPSAMVFCDSAMRHLRFELYQQMQNGPRLLERTLALLPMRRILYANDAFLFHSSRIVVDGRAILFSGPSGAGKTTQALLWKQYEKTPHLCNDRTIIRYEDTVWNTYGYFQDGSKPIGDNKCLPLGAIVFLEHGEKNCISRINGRIALKLLMGQIFMDSWDYEMIAGITEIVVSLLKDIPIYSLQCVPDRSAVECLKRKLKEEGVIK